MKIRLLLHPTMLLIMGTIPLILGGLYPNPILSELIWGGYKFNSAPLFFILLCIISFEFGVLIAAKYSLRLRTAKNVIIAKLILLVSFTSLFLYIGRTLYFLGDIRNVFNHATLYNAKNMAIIPGVTTFYHAITGPLLFFFWLNVHRKAGRYKKILVVSLALLIIAVIFISERGTLFNTIVALAIFYLIINEDKNRITKNSFMIMLALILVLFILFSYIQKFRIAPLISMSFFEVLRLGASQILFYGTINYRNLDVVMQNVEPFAIFKLANSMFGIKSSYVENLYISLIRGGAGTFSAYGDLYIDLGYGSLITWMLQGFFLGLLYRSKDITGKALYAFLSSLLLQSFMISFYYSRVFVSLFSILVCFHPIIRRD